MGKKPFLAGWEIFEENAYEVAKRPGVLEEKLLLQIKEEMEQIVPMPAVFENSWVKKLNGPNVKKGKNKMDLAKQVMADIENFKKKHNCE